MRQVLVEVVFINVVHFPHPNRYHYLVMRYFIIFCCVVWLQQLSCNREPIKNKAEGAPVLINVWENLYSSNPEDVQEGLCLLAYYNQDILISYPYQSPISPLHIASVGEFGIRLLESKTLTLIDEAINSSTSNCNISVTNVHIAIDNLAIGLVNAAKQNKKLLPDEFPNLCLTNSQT